MNDPAPTRSRWTARAVLTVVVLVVASFAGGYAWQFVEARAARAERDELRSRLILQEMATTLATAVLQADGGAYENARTLMSTYFTRLQEHVSSQPSPPAVLRDVLARRDAVITLLSREDPSSEETLARLFTRYQVVLGDSGTTLPIPAAATGSTGSTDSVAPAAGQDTSAVSAPDSVDGG